MLEARGWCGFRRSPIAHAPKCGNFISLVVSLSGGLLCEVRCDARFVHALVRTPLCAQSQKSERDS